MARPLKVGIDYFPTDVDIDQDDKVKMVKNKYGLMGMGTVVMLLARIYKNGYFYHWTEREQELFCGDYREEVNAVENVVNECIKWGLFHKNLFEEHQILTSAGIQKRYLLAVERRKDKHIIDEYWLIEKEVNDNGNVVNVNNNSVNADKKPVNASKSTQSKVNETKVNKRKKKDTHPELFEQFWNVYPRHIERPNALTKWNAQMNKGEDPQQIITSAYNYMIYVSAEGTETKYMKHPKTFLNGDTWKEFLNPVLTEITPSKSYRTKADETKRQLDLLNIDWKEGDRLEPKNERARSQKVIELDQDSFSIL